MIIKEKKKKLEVCRKGAKVTDALSGLNVIVFKVFELFFEHTKAE